MLRKLQREKQQIRMMGVESFVLLFYCALFILLKWCHGTYTVLFSYVCRRTWRFSASRMRHRDEVHGCDVWMSFTPISFLYAHNSRLHPWQSSFIPSHMSLTPFHSHSFFPSRNVHSNLTKCCDISIHFYSSFCHVKLLFFAQVSRKRREGFLCVNKRMRIISSKVILIWM